MVLNHSVGNNVFNFNSIAYNAMQVRILHINIQKMPHIIPAQRLYLFDERWYSAPSIWEFETAFYVLLLGYISIGSAAAAGPLIGLGTSGSMGDPDPYPWVFWAPKVIPGSVKFFPTDHPEPWVKNPQVHRYPWVYLWVPSRSEQINILFLNIYK